MKNGYRGSRYGGVSRSWAGTIGLALRFPGLVVLLLIGQSGMEHSFQAAMTNFVPLRSADRLSFASTSTTTPRWYSEVMRSMPPLPNVLEDLQVSETEPL